jgi:hypothetical protein
VLEIILTNIYKDGGIIILMEKNIGKIKKNPETDIVIMIDDFGGKPGLTIREYATSERYKGFTKSGTKISAESFEEFKDMINSIKIEDFKDIGSAPVEKIPQKKLSEDIDDDASGIDEEGLM